MAGSLAFALEPDDLLVISDELAEPDFEDLLLDDSAARAGVPAGEPSPEPEIVEARARGWALRVILEEGIGGYLAKKFDEHKHPRWPKGTPKAGKFMRVGDVFKTKDGRQWQVVHASGHGMRVVASDYSGKTADRISLKADSSAHAGTGVGVPGILPPDPKGFDRMNAPVTSPYVDPSTHDPSLELPAGSKISAEQWKRFGREDQEYYLDLMDRFGDWKPSNAKTMMAAVYNEYNSAVQAQVSKAYSKNKGGTGFWHAGAGQWLNLASMFGHSSTGTETPQPKVAPAKFEEYAETKAAFEEMTEVVHWDLMNRCKSPDITLFHGGSGQPLGQPGSSHKSGVAQYQEDYIGGKVPIYAGFSQSYSLHGAESWGSTVLMTPTAVRHVAMSYYTPLPGGSAHWGELEIAVSARMKLDDRSVAFASHDYGMGGQAARQAVSKWLHGDTSKQPTSGVMVQELKDVWAGKGHIPIPEEPAGIVPISTGGAKYKPLTPEQTAQATKLAKEAKYKSEDGSKEGAIGEMSGMGLKPGDFIEGMKGTRYVIIADEADAAGLRYVKVMDMSGTPVPAIDYSKSYPVGGKSETFFRLDAHMDFPKEKVVGFVGLTPEDYAKLVPGEKKKLIEYKPGEMFKSEGEGYKVLGPGAGGKVEVESLDTGKQFYANGLHPTPQLVAAKGFTGPAGWTTQDAEDAVTAVPVFEAGELVKLMRNGQVHLAVVKSHDAGSGTYDLQLPHTGSVVSATAEDLSAAPTLPGEKSYETGDKFAFEGSTYTVTSILKDGTVRARVSGGSVQKFSKASMESVVVYRPSTFAIGNEAKAGALDVGDVVQGGAGAKVRPYVIVAKAGSKVHLLNLETGEHSQVTKNKTFKRLLDVEQIKAQGEPAKTGEHHGPAGLAPEFAPTGVMKPVKDLQVDDVVKINNKLWQLQEIGDDGSQSFLIHEPDGTQKPITIPAVTVKAGDLPTEVYALATPAQVAAKPELAGKFNADDWEHGPKAKLKDMPQGAVFLSATGIAMQLKSTSPKGGATAVALHNGKLVKNISYDKDFTTLVEKPPVVVAADEPGDAPIPPPPPEPIHADEVAALGDGDYVTYLHPKSGQNKYPKLVQMPVGTVFTDKAGKPWKMHSSNGGSVVISDGTKLWSADPGWRGKVDEEGKVAFLDNATSAPAAAETGDTTVGHLKVGDQFQIPAGYAGAGKWYEVLDTTPTEHAAAQILPDDAPAYTTIKVKSLSFADGPETEIATSLVPASVKPASSPPAHDNFEVAGDPAPLDELPVFGFAMTVNGKVGYKTKNGEFYVLGRDAPMDVPDSAKLTPMQWTGPPADTDALHMTGEKGLAHDLAPGTYFSYSGVHYLKIADGKSGFVGQKVGSVGDNYVAFQSKASNPEVSILSDRPQKVAEPDAPEAKPIAIGDLKDGMTVYGTDGTEMYVKKHAGKSGLYLLFSPGDEIQGIKIKPHDELYAQNPKPAATPSGSHPLIGATFSGTLVASVPTGAHVVVMQSTDKWGTEKFEALGHGKFKLVGGKYASGAADWRNKNLKVKVVGGAPPSPKLVLPSDAPEIGTGPLPAQMKANDGGLAFKDLPVGTFYAVDLGDSYAIQKVNGPDGEQIEVQGPWGPGLADPESVPSHIWTPGNAPATAPADKPKMPKVHDKLPAGEVTDTNPNHPDGPKVEINGGNYWLSLEDAQKPPAATKTVKDLKAGDTFRTPGGKATFVMVSDDQWKMIISATGEPSAGGHVFDKKHLGMSGDTVEMVAAPAGTPQPANLAPYLHAKSGKHKYPKLGTLDEGTVVQDKAGKKFSIAQKKGDTLILLPWDAAKPTNTPLMASADVRVKVVATL